RDRARQSRGRLAGADAERVAIDASAAFDAAAQAVPAQREGQRSRTARAFQRQGAAGAVAVRAGAADRSGAPRRGGIGGAGEEIGALQHVVLRRVAERGAGEADVDADVGGFGVVGIEADVAAPFGEAAADGVVPVADRRAEPAARLDGPDGRRPGLFFLLFGRSLFDGIGLLGFGGRVGSGRRGGLDRPCDVVVRFGGGFLPL